MSSSPLTESPLPTTRWRKPATWPLRTRLVAIMIALLCMLGVLVAGTTEIFLNKTLYEQTDAKLRDAQGRTHNFYGSNGQSGVRPPRASRSDGGAPPGTQVGQLIAVMNSAGTIDFAVYAKSAPDYSVSMADLPADARKKVAALTPDGKEHTVDLGSLGAYRLIASFDPNGSGTVNVAGLPLSELRRTLLRVALVTGGAVLIALGIAGWAGAVIVRRTLRPLDRVAATATRVSELRLDHGEVRLAQRVPAGDTDPHTEVGQVGAALNRMLDHVGNALEARHASEMQVRQFVADASHELRTPLAAIRGYAELSRRSRAPISEEIAHVLGRVESEAKRMTGLVEDLLLLARLDSGRPLAHDPVDLTMLVVDAVSDAHAAGPRHYWQLDLPEEPVTVVGDGQRLHQVLANLLANARTHTPEGTTVTVAVGATADAAVLRVIDFGPGIPAELQPHIFERFARGDSSRSRAAGSTGLGLSIVSAVVAAHRGTVSVDSQPGQTVFTVTLPLARVPAGEQLARTLPRAR